MPGRVLRSEVKGQGDTETVCTLAADGSFHGAASRVICFLFLVNRN